MSDVAAPGYNVLLMQALTARKDWLEKSELAKLKEELRIFQISYSVLYNMLLKKKLINEDPYKQEAKISELEVPDAGPFNEAKKLEQVSLRLANYDNQLDFLVNFCQFGVDYLNLERIRRILGLVRFIDWSNFTPDSQSVNTKFFAEVVAHAKSGADPLNLSIIGESLTKLPKCAGSTLKILRDLASYHRETYKLNVRTAIGNLAAGDANAAGIKKKMNSAMPGTPFIAEYIEELIKEDYSSSGPAMKEQVLKMLAVAEDKPKSSKAPVSYKNILLDGIQSIGSASTVMTETAEKLDENELVLENRKKSFWEKLRLLIRTMMKADPEEVVFDLVYVDREKGTQTRDSLNFHQFRADLDKKIKILTGMGARGPVMAKLNAMQEEQITGYLERTIRDVQNIFKTLTALDEYFKSTVTPEDRGKIKGIKPELASIKNCIVRANQLRYEYSAAKEEQEQMKRMGINPDS
jgi:hypothetical protein